MMRKRTAVATNSAVKEASDAHDGRDAATTATTTTISFSSSSASTSACASDSNDNKTFFSLIFPPSSSYQPNNKKFKKDTTETNNANDTSDKHFTWIEKMKAILMHQFFSTAGDATYEFRQNVDKNKHRYKFLYGSYVASCFIYTVGGMVVLYQQDTLEAKWSKYWPWQVEGWCFIVQGFISYMSDVYTMGYLSYWNVIDRWCATILFLVVMTRIILVIQTMMMTTTTTIMDVNNSGKNNNNDNNHDTHLYYFLPFPNDLSFYLFWMFCLTLCISTYCFHCAAMYTYQMKPKESMIAQTLWHTLAPFVAILLCLSF